MATQLTPVTKVGPYVATPVTANSLDLAWTAADVAGNYVTVTSGTSYLILMLNSHATLARTVTFTSVADSPFVRTGDIAAYSMAAGIYSHFYFSAHDGWKDGSNQIHFTASTADVKFLVISF